MMMKRPEVEMEIDGEFKMRGPDVFHDSLGRCHVGSWLLRVSACVCAALRVLDQQLLGIFALQRPQLTLFRYARNAKPCHWLGRVC